MNNLFKVCLLVLLFVSTAFLQKVIATHLGSGELTYRYLHAAPNGDDVYEVNVKWIRDCSNGAFVMPNTHQYLVRSSCVNIILPLEVHLKGSQIITPICRQNIGCTQTNIYKEYLYKDTVQLSPCTDWEIHVGSCCRNASITTGAGTSTTLYLVATLNNFDFPGNSSPTFQHAPLASICVGHPYYYNHGAQDHPGHQLVYSLVAPQSGNGVSIPYNSPLSGTNPYYGTISIDPNTGAISGLATQPAITVMAVKVTEIGPSGRVKGTVIRDIQVEILSGCSNLPPLATIQQTPITVCPGTPISTIINASDANGHDVFMSINGLPQGATFSINSNNSSSPFPSGIFNWTPTLSDLGTHSFIIMVRDDACPINGFNYFTYTIHVINNSAPPTATATPFPDTVCLGELLTFNVTSDDPEMDAITMSYNINGAGATFGISNNNSASPFPSGNFSWAPGHSDVGPRYLDVTVSSPNCSGLPLTNTYRFNFYVKDCCTDTLSYQVSACRPFHGRVGFSEPGGAGGSNSTESANCDPCTNGFLDLWVIDNSGNLLDANNDPCLTIEWYDNWSKGNLLGTGTYFRGVPDTHYKIRVVDTCGGICLWEDEFIFRCCDYHSFEISRVPGLDPCLNPGRNFLLEAKGNLSSHATSPGPVTYQWTASDPLVNSSSKYLGGSPNVTYYLEVTDSTGCIHRDTFIFCCTNTNWDIIVYPGSKPCNNPNQTFLIGASQTSGSPAAQPITYHWSASDPNANVSGNSSYISALPDITYYLEVTDGDGCVYRDTFLHTCCAAPTNLRCGVTKVNGAPKTVFFWDPVPGATSYTVTVNTGDQACCRRVSSLPASSIYTTTSTHKVLQTMLSSTSCASWSVSADCSWGATNSSPTICVNTRCLAPIIQNDSSGNGGGGEVEVSPYVGSWDYTKIDLTNGTLQLMGNDLGEFTGSGKDIKGELTISENPNVYSTNVAFTAGITVFGTERDIEVEKRSSTGTWTENAGEISLKDDNGNQVGVISSTSSKIVFTGNFTESIDIQFGSIDANSDVEFTVEK